MLPSPGVVQAAQVGIGTEQLCGLAPRKQLHGCAPRRPLLRPGLQEGDAALALSTLHIARAHRVAGDAVALYELEHQIAGGMGHGVDTLAALGSVHGIDLIGQALHARIDLTAVAPRGAPTRLRGLHHGHRVVRLGEMQCRREAGESGADDGDINREIVTQRRAVRGGCGGLGPQARWPDGVDVSHPVRHRPISTCAGRMVSARPAYRVHRQSTGWSSSSRPRRARFRPWQGRCSSRAAASRHSW